MKITVVRNIQFKQNMRGWKINTFMLTIKYEERLTWFVLENHSSHVKISLNLLNLK
jgi:hypothetical protein